MSCHIELLGFGHPGGVLSYFWRVDDNSSFKALQWRHNGRDGVSNHQPYVCLLNRLFRRRSKKASKLRVTGLCEGNSPVTGEFPAQRASNVKTASIWWRHHGSPFLLLVLAYRIPITTLYIHNIQNELQNLRWIFVRLVAWSIFMYRRKKTYINHFSREQRLHIFREI